MKLGVCKRCTILSFTRIIYFGCGRQVELHLSWRIISVWLSALSSPTSWPNVINLTINARHLIISRNSALVCIHIQNIRKLHRAARWRTDEYSFNQFSSGNPLAYKHKLTMLIKSRCKQIQQIARENWIARYVARKREKRARFMAAYSRTHIQMESAARGIKS